MFLPYHSLLHHLVFTCEMFSNIVNIDEYMFGVVLYLRNVIHCSVCCMSRMMYSYCMFSECVVFKIVVVVGVVLMGFQDVVFLLS